MSQMLDELSNFIFVSKYARYNEKQKRRETWEEAVSRVEQMHLKKFSYLSDEIKKEISWSFDLVRQKKIVPSMRSMQFGGNAVEAHEARIFNCSVVHVDSIRTFSEVFYLLLCGCGVGIGLNNFFLGRLPDLVNADDKTGTILTYVVEDSIEGWSDSLQALLNCYFKNTCYSGRKIVFDYSRIRRKGAKLKTGGGKAPGYKPLKSCHIKIKILLDKIIEEYGQARLKSINAYDIMMHCADAVLSGGVRRSATCVIFDKDDEDMLNAKTGDWFKENPQRGRSNNSVLLLRDKISKEEFQNIVERTKQWGEPGFVFANEPHTMYNPCQPSWAKLLTPEGIRNLGDVKEGDKIWSETGWTTVIKKWSTGIKKVYKYQTTANCFYGTENHKLVSGGIKIEAKDCESIDSLSGDYNNYVSINTQDVVDGLMIGDGSVHKASNNLKYLSIGKDDYDYFNSEIKDFILEYRPGLSEYAYIVKTTINILELPKTYDRKVPDRFIQGNKNTKCGFLRGLYSANGSICGNRVTLKASSFKIIEDVQLMLSSLGIRSYFTTNRSTSVKFDNGEYVCKQSYDLNISTDREKFVNVIGFIQEYKNEKTNLLIKKLNTNTHIKNTYNIISVDFISEEEVFDITVDNASHTYWTQGCNVSNCFEIGFIPVTKDGRCGVQFCNLTSLNGAKIKNKEDFKLATKAATIIGTLQASYTHFPYLGKTAEQLTKEEALLGVSITGIMDSADILLDKANQKEMAQFAVEVNKEWAKIIGIRAAARIGCIKPEGTCSLALGCSSGIHPHHAHKYFRRVQVNQEDNVFKFFKKHNPHMCEKSVWSAGKTDEVITFPLTIPKTAITKDSLTALEHLEIIKSTQQGWVLSSDTGINTKDVSHNVSCTVIVKQEEWQGVIDYIYKNKGFFSAVSLISSSGDKDYAQAPNEKVVTEDDKKKFYDIIENYKQVDYTKLIEEHDDTKVQETLSCAGGKCEL